MIYSEKWKELLCFDLCVKGNSFFCTLGDRNAICEINTKECKLNILGFFPEMSKCAKSTSLCCELHNKKVFFCPTASRHIGVYDTENKNIEFIKVPKIKNDLTGRYDENQKFYDSVAVNNKLYLQSIMYPGILEMDTDTYEIRCIDDWVSLVEKKSYRKTSLTTRGSVFWNGSLYFPLGGASGLLRIDINKHKSDYIDIPFDLKGLYGITQVGKYGFVTEHSSTSDRMVCIDFESYNQEEIPLPAADTFLPPVCYKDNLFFFPNKFERGFCYDLKAKTWEETTEIFKEVGKVSFSTSNGDEVILGSQNGGLFSWRQGEKLKKINIVIDDEDYLVETWKEHVSGVLDNARSKPIIEGRDGLVDFLGGIINA